MKQNSNTQTQPGHLDLRGVALDLAPVRVNLLDLEMHDAAHAPPDSLSGLTQDGFLDGRRDRRVGAGWVPDRCRGVCKILANVNFC